MCFIKVLLCLLLSARLSLIIYTLLVVWSKSFFCRSTLLACIYPVINSYFLINSVSVLISIRQDAVLLLKVSLEFAISAYMLLVLGVCLCLVQMETEPVTASEPVFSAVQTASQVPVIPNGSGSQTKPDELSGKLTAEQLAAIEDEELLDKMVPHTRVIMLNDLDLKAPLCNEYNSFCLTERFV